MINELKHTLDHHLEEVHPKKSLATIFLEKILTAFRLEGAEEMSKTK